MFLLININHNIFILIINLLLYYQNLIINKIWNQIIIIIIIKYICYFIRKFNKINKLFNYINLDNPNSNYLIPILLILFYKENINLNIIDLFINLLVFLIIIYLN